MNTKPIITIRKSIAAVLLMALLAAAALAHGGLEHVLGTVAKITSTVITVKTTAGKTVEVGINAKTVITKAEKPLPVGEIHVGDRVAIHAEKEGAALTAHTVEVGTAAAAKTSSK